MNNGKTTNRKRKAAMKIDGNHYPKGWNAGSVRDLAEHYEKQTQEQAVVEDDAAYRSITQTMMAVPIALVPAVQRLIAKKAS
jgi:hypothetical protein